jgi:hypothetical protein
MTGLFAAVITGLFTTVVVTAVFFTTVLLMTGLFTAVITGLFAAGSGLVLFAV